MKRIFETEGEMGLFLLALDEHALGFYQKLSKEELVHMALIKLEKSKEPSAQLTQALLKKGVTLDSLRKE